MFVVDGTDAAALVLATEMATSERIAALSEMSGSALPHVVLTHYRAET